MNDAIIYFTGPADAREARVRSRASMLRTPPVRRARLYRAPVRFALRSLCTLRVIIFRIGAHLERRFCVFADIPYCDARTRRRFGELMDDSEAREF
jgi:hypothetical protein